MVDFNSRRLPIVIVLFCFVITLVLIILSKGTYDPGDGVQHYLIAKYALKHPLLFLDHWGKPIYTLLCMPFAQAGFLGSNIYNLLCNSLTSYFAFHIAQKLGYKNAWLAIVFVFFSPLFFVTSFSGLTEPTFALILTGSVLFMLRSNYAFGAILISFLPFARTEGFFIVPLFVIYLINQKQWKAALLTASGSLVYSFIGWFILHDFLWIMHQNPYKGAIDIYGKGTLMHFVAANDRLFGLPLVFLFIVGCISLIFKKERNLNNVSAFYLLILGSFIVYFTLHSIFWWKGLFGSLGLHRVMAGVAPLFSIIALVGFNLITSLFEAKPKIHKVIFISVVFAVVVYPFKQYRPPIKPDIEMQVLINTSTWIKSNAISVNKKVYCMYPYLAMLLDVDVFNTDKYISTCMLQHTYFSNALLPGDIIFWDSHFGHECGYSPDSISKLMGVKKIATFKQTTKNQEEFEVFVYLKE